MSKNIVKNEKNEKKNTAKAAKAEVSEVLDTRMTRQEAIAKLKKAKENKEKGLPFYTKGKYAKCRMGEHGEMVEYTNFSDSQKLVDEKVKGLKIKRALRNELVRDNGKVDGNVYVEFSGLDDLWYKRENLHTILGVPHVKAEKNSDPEARAARKHKNEAESDMAWLRAKAEVNPHAAALLKELDDEKAAAAAAEEDEREFGKKAKQIAKTMGWTYERALEFIKANKQ